MLYKNITAAYEWYVIKYNIKKEIKENKSYVHLRIDTKKIKLKKQKKNKTFKIDDLRVNGWATNGLLCGRWMKASRLGDRLWSGRSKSALE